MTVATAPSALTDYEVRREIIAAATANPVVGMPATFGIGSDSYAAEIVSVSASGKTIHVSPGGKFMRKASGGFGRKGGGYVYLGIAEDYRDPSF